MTTQTLIAIVNHGTRLIPSKAEYKWEVDFDSTNPLAFSFLQKGFQETLTDANSTCKGIAEPATPEERRAAVEARFAKILAGTYCQKASGGGGRKSILTLEDKALNETLQELGLKGKLADFGERLRSFAKIQILTQIQAENQAEHKRLMLTENIDELNTLVDDNLDDVVALLQETEFYKKKLIELQTPPAPKPSMKIGTLKLNLAPKA